MPSCGPGSRKNGTSAPIVAASSREPRRRSSGSGRSSFASRSAAAASELPPPSPAATGIAFSISTLQRGSTPAAAASASSASRHDRVVGEPGHGKPLAGRQRDACPRARSAAARSRPRACRPPLGGADDEREVDLRVRPEPVHPEQPCQLEEDGRGERLGAHCRVEPERGERRHGLLAGRHPGELERVRERLAPMGERALDDPAEAREVAAAGSCAGTRRAPSRRWAAAGRRSARPDGSRSAPSRAGSGPRRLRTPSSTARRRSGLRPRAAPSRTRARCREGRRGSRRRSGWRRCTGGSRRASSARGRGSRDRAAGHRPSGRVTFGRGRDVAEVRFEPSVELDGVNVGALLGQHAGQGAEARADLEHDVGGVELGQPGDDAEDVVVDEEVLPERLLGLRPAHGAGSPKAAVAFRSICLLEQPRSSSPRASARTASVWSTLAGSFRLPRSGCGARYGLSVSARMRSAGHRRRGFAELGRLRVRDVAGERDVVAPLDRDVEQPRRREAMEDHGAREAGQGGRRVRIGVARVDHDRQAGRRRDLELAVEERALRRDAARDRGSSRDPSPRPRRPAGAEQLDELVDPRSPPGLPA